jgi:hypothetical protein
VDVDNGLFNAKIPVIRWYFNGQALWVRVRVRPSGGTWDPWMTPRQEILPVPYALSLRPGATIEGEQVDWDAIHAVNTASTGESYGVYGRSHSPEGSGGYFDGSAGAAAIKAAGTGIVQSTAKTTVWIPGSEAVVRVGTGGLDLLYHGDGIVRLNADTDGAKQIVIPLSVPAVLYGQPVRVEQIGYTYKCKGASDSYIDVLRIYRHDGVGNSRAVLEIFTDRDCTDANWYSPSYSFPTDNVLSADDGILTLEITADMKAAAGSEIWIGGVRVVLGHDG